MRVDTATLWFLRGCCSTRQDVILLPAATRYQTPGVVNETSTERRIIFSPAAGGPASSCPKSPEGGSGNPVRSHGPVDPGGPVRDETLVGFLRDDGLTVYTGEQRIQQ